MSGWVLGFVRVEWWRCRGVVIGSGEAGERRRGIAAWWVRTCRADEVVWLVGLAGWGW